nr:hypothetical protein [uncultured Devosia sp.]
MGKAPVAAPLPKADDPITISPPVLPVQRGAALEDAKRQVARLRSNFPPTVQVQARLIRPHELIVSWLTKHKDLRKRALSELDPWTRKALDPGKFRAVDNRRHRILDALFKAIERLGGRITEGERNDLFAEMHGAKIAFQMREKQDQMRRPLTSDEQQLRSPDDNMWKRELVPTGRLVFQFRMPQWPPNLPRQWLESGGQTMERMLPDILAIFVAAAPSLVQQQLEREAAEHDRRSAEQSRHEAQRQRQRDADRWLSFSEMAQDWYELASAREFLAALRSMDGDLSVEIEGRTVKQWIAWAEEWLTRADPTSDGIAGVFRRVAQAEHSIRSGGQSDESRGM